MVLSVRSLAIKLSVPRIYTESSICSELVVEASSLRHGLCASSGLYIHALTRMDKNRFWMIFAITWTIACAFSLPISQMFLL